MELLARIERREDYMVEELGLEYLEATFRVSFIRDQVEVPPEDFCLLVRNVLSEGGHPGTITFMEDDCIISVRKADEVPEQARFADTARGPVPVVKVVMSMMNDTTREIVEYGPNDERLRSTVQLKS